jgi:hypothetical protein
MIVYCGGHAQALEAVDGAGQVAGAADSFGGEAAVCEVAADAEADLGFAIGDVGEVDPAGDTAVVGEQDVEEIGACGLRRQQRRVASGVSGAQLPVDRPVG